MSPDINHEIESQRSVFFVDEVWDIAPKAVFTAPRTSQIAVNNPMMMVSTAGDQWREIAQRTHDYLPCVCMVAGDDQCRRCRLAKLLNETETESLQEKEQTS